MSRMTPRALSTFCCSVTPFGPTGSLDVPAVRAHFARQAAAGVGCGPHVRDPHVPLTAGELTRVAKRLAELRVGESEGAAA